MAVLEVLTTAVVMEVLAVMEVFAGDGGIDDGSVGYNGDDGGAGYDGVMDVLATKVVIEVLAYGRTKLLATTVAMEVMATIVAMETLATLAGWRYWLRQWQSGCWLQRRCCL